MVSPSKTKHSRVAANQQQRTANASKVKLVKGPTPLVHHRFYLDIQKHQLANKIEYTIKELGGHIEFFLSKDITHFITDKDYSHYQQSGTTSQNPEGGPSNSYHNNPVTPTTPLTPKTPLSTTNRHHYLQYVNEASPSSPSCGTTTGHSSHLQQQGGPGSVGAASGTTFGGSESRPTKLAAPRSRADAMLQRVRQQQQLQQSPGGSSTYNHSLLAQRNNASRPCSPLSPSPVPSPTPAASSTAAVRLDRNSQSPAQLAKSWGKPIWSTEYAIKFLSKVIGSCKQENQQQQQQHGQQQQNLRFGKGSSKGSEGKTTPQHLRGDYIKIESHQRHHYRPAFALFKAWPALNLVAKSNHSPFDSTRGKAGEGQRSVQPSVQPATTTVQATTTTQVQEDRPSVVKTATTNQTTTNATAKQENTQQQQQQQQCGYCEICRIEYDVLANHLNADEHRAFVRNDGNFTQLDQLIADGGVDLGAFLKSVEKEQEEVTICEEPSEDSEPEPRKDATEEPGEEEKCEKEEEVVKVKKRRVDKAEETLLKEKETVQKGKCSEEIQEEQEEEVRKELEGRVLELRITPVAIPLKTYSRKSKEIPPSPLSTPSAAIKRTYAGRKSARTTTLIAEPSPAPAATPANLAAIDLEPDAAVTVAADDSQMFGRRSAIHHHPHNTLSHHNHQKAKAARQQLKEQQEKQDQEKSVPEPEPIEVPEEDAVEQAVMKLHGTNESTTTTKQNNSKMGMKQSSVVKSPSAAELALECDGLDPKNTKRISLGLRQNPKRANLNEDFTSLLDETLEPIRKPARIRRESVRRVNYSEPREDEIASQEELIESILLESTAQEAAAAAAAAAEESCRGKKKMAGGSPKRSGSDVKIRGIRWRAPSPQSRPPVKSPLLYQVIEEPKAKSKKNNSASPTKEASGTPGSPTKASKNGLIVKIRRVRQSELSLLNDEAENFMFPKKDDSSDEETDEDRQTSSEANPGDYSQEVPSSDYDHPHNSSKRKSAGTPLPTPQPIKKRPVGRPPASAKESTPTPAAPATPDPSDTSTPRSRRAGVRGVAALLHDNAEYYKFPDPGSRLRFPEAPIQPGTVNPEAAVDDDDSEVQAALMPAPAPKRRGRKPAKTPALSTVTTPLSPEQRQQQDLLLATRGASGCSSPYQHQEQLSTCGKVIADYSKYKGNCGSSSKEDGMGAAAMFKWSTFVRNCEQIEPYRFAFERVPSLEPWYETFQRQDGASEKVYEYFGNTAYRKLPYEMGGIPPLRQNCCILNYRIKSKTPESTVPSSSNSSTCDGATTTKDQPAKPSSSTSSTSEPLSLPLKKRKLLVDSDRPRKSPREHASTLAILSLLQQQTQVNRRRTISGGSSAVPPLNLPPPSPVPSVGYSPKKEAIKAQQQQEADSALGDEIRSSCGSDPVTEKDEPMTGGSGSGIGAKKIKFDPPIMPEQSFVNYKVMCQQLEEFLEADGIPEDDALPELPKAVPIVPAPSEPLKQNLLNIVQACDKEPPLSLKLVSRHESIVRKIVQYDRRPRPLSAITIKSFDGGGGGGGSQPGLGTPGGTCLGIFKKRINRTGWPNVKKRIVTRKQHQQKTSKRDSAESAGAAGEVKKEPEPPEDTSRKSSTEESQVSAETAVVEGEEEEVVKQEVEGEEAEAEEEEEDDDEDEFEDTMTMLDPEEVVAVTTVAAAAKTNGETAKKEVVGGTGKVVAAATAATEQLLTDDEEEEKKVVEEEREEQQQQREEMSKEEMEESRQTPEPTKTEEILIPSRPCQRSSTSLPSSKYVTKTTTTMTRIDYNVPSTPSSELSQKAPAPMEVANTVPEECDSISSRSIFVSDDCDTTSSTLINMCPEADPLALPCTPPLVDAVENDGDSRPVTPTVTTVRSRQNSTRHVGGGSSPGKKRGNLQPIVCLQKINCTAATASSMRTRSSSRTPIKKTYKRSIFTSALVNSSGKPLKKKRKRKKLKLMNGGSTAGTTSPSCSEGHNSSSIADEPTNEEEEDAEEEPEDESGTDGTDSPTVVRRGPASKNRAPTPSPVKFSPRKLRKPRGRWYRER